MGKKSLADRLERTARRERLTAWYTRKSQQAWKTKLSEDVFREVRDRVIYSEEDEGVGVFFLRNIHEPHRVWVKNDVMMTLGRSNWRDDTSQSCLLRIKALPYIPLTRFAWWYHHGEDCGGAQFPLTGGCRVIDDHPPKNMHPDNLALVRAYQQAETELQETQAIDEYRQHIAERLPSIIKKGRLATAIRYCQEFDIDDPLKEALARNPHVDINDLLPDPEQGDIFRKHTGETVIRTSSGPVTRHRSWRKLYVEIGDCLVPAEYVMWYLCTGTFAGQLGFKSGGVNIRLYNLKLMEPGYRELFSA